MCEEHIYKSVISVHCTDSMVIFCLYKLFPDLAKKIAST